MPDIKTPIEKRPCGVTSARSFFVLKALQIAEHSVKQAIYLLFRADSKLKNLCPQKLKKGLSRNTFTILVRA
ncbi:MAG: hypothetical protein ACLTEF_14815 [[Clostridium] leptum]